MATMYPRVWAVGGMVTSTDLNGVEQVEGVEADCGRFSPQGFGDLGLFMWVSVKEHKQSRREWEQRGLLPLLPSSQKECPAF